MLNKGLKYVSLLSAAIIFGNEVDGQNLSFAKSFDLARKELGEYGAFEYHGRLYGTYYYDDWAKLTLREKRRIYDDIQIRHKVRKCVNQHFSELGIISKYKESYNPDQTIDYYLEIFSAKHGSQTSDRYYQIHYTVDLTQDRLKYLSEYIERNPLPQPYKGQASTIYTGWMQYYEKDYNHGVSDLAKEIRKIVNLDKLHFD